MPKDRVTQALERITAAQVVSGLSIEAFYTALAKLSERPAILKTVLAPSDYTIGIPDASPEVKLLDQLTEQPK